MPCMLVSVVYYYDCFSNPEGYCLLFGFVRLVYSSKISFL